MVQFEPSIHVLDTKMRHPVSSEMFAYWQRLRGNNPAPLRNAIEPSDIRRILPDLFILEKTADGIVGFRLAGTRICTLFGREFRGYSFTAMWDSVSSDRVENAALDVMDHCAPMIFSAQANIDANRHIDIEITMLPVSSAEGQTDRLIGSLAVLDPSQLRAGEVALSLNFQGVRVLNSDNARIEDPAPAQRTDHQDVSVHQPSTLGLFFHRVMHLRVFDGGRQD
jgi:hypothetical protein